MSPRTQKRWNIEHHFFVPPKRPGEDGLWDWNLVAYEPTLTRAKRRAEDISCAFKPGDFPVFRVRLSEWLSDARQWEDADDFHEYESGSWTHYQ